VGWVELAAGMEGMSPRAGRRAGGQAGTKAGSALQWIQSARVMGLKRGGAWLALQLAGSCLGLALGEAAAWLLEACGVPPHCMFLRTQILHPPSCTAEVYCCAQCTDLSTSPDNW